MSKNLFRSAAAVGVLSFALSPAHAAVSVGVNPDNITLGFMNVFELDGTFVFASGWGVSDLVAEYSPGTLTLLPNSIGDPDPFWYQGGGGPGAQGNKIMEANLYAQVDDGSLSGTTVTFSGTVLSDTFTDAHDAFIFIRDFAADFSSSVDIFIPLTAGDFSLSLDTIADPTRHVQYGFQVVGENVWETDIGPFGSAEIATIPVPAALPLLLSALGFLGFSSRRR